MQQSPGNQGFFTVFLCYVRLNDLNSLLVGKFIRTRSRGAQALLTIDQNDYTEI